MWKIIWTTIFWALILVIAWFYLKFMDQDMGQQVSNWIMSVETTTDTTATGDVLSGSIDPIQSLLSGVNAMQQQLADWLSGLNTKLDDTKTLIEDVAKPKTTTTTTTKKPEAKTETWTSASISTWS